jgi:hypothetical protein
MARFIFTVALAALPAFAFTSIANAQTNLTTETAAESTNGLPVYSLRILELREGVEAEKFEEFVTDEFATVFAKPIHGIHPLIVKGDRGAAKGKYRLVVVFASKEIRDKYFPVEDGEPSKALKEDATATQVKTIEKLGTFVNFIEYTDFVGIGR